MGPPGFLFHCCWVPQVSVILKRQDHYRPDISEVTLRAIARLRARPISDPPS